MTVAARATWQAPCRNCEQGATLFGVRALLIGNQGDDDPGVVGAALADHGYELHHTLREQLTEPPTLDGFDIVVSLGSEWSIPGCSAPELVELELSALRQAHDSGTPVLGICFGGQMLAAALGGTVERAPEPEVGLYPIESSDPELIPGGPWVQWHYDRFVPPPAARVLATSPAACQAFVVGNTLGLQFHPEVDDAIVTRWAKGDSDLSGAGRTPDGVLANVRPGLALSARLGSMLVAEFLARTTAK